MKKNTTKTLFIVILITTFMSVGYFVIAEELPPISDNIKSAISEKDINGIYCLMTKWKSRHFLTALDVLVDSKIAGAEIYKIEIQSQINTICSSTDYKESKQAINNLKDYYQTIKKNLNKLDKEQKKEIKKSIDEAIKNREVEYQIYLKQALQKRKEIILKILDIKIKNNTDKIRALFSSQDIINEYLEKIQTLRDTAGSKIQKALNSNDEEKLNLAISEFQTEWNKIKEEIEQKLTEQKNSL